MRRIRMWGWVFAAAWVLVAAGCWPNRVAVSPDGRTMYFSLNKEGGIKTEDGSNIYALDVETDTLEALTDAPYAEGWCALSKDGKQLTHSAAAGTLRIAMILNLEKGKDRPFSLLMTGAEKAYLYPYFVHERGVLAMEMENVGEQEGRWVLVGEWGAKALPLPEGFLALFGEVAVDESGFICGVAREVPPEEASGSGEEDKGGLEVAVYAIVLSEQAEEAPPGPEGDEAAEQEAGEADQPAALRMRAECLGKWRMETVERLDLAYEDTECRLLAAIMAPASTRVFELHPEAEPTPVFEEKAAYAPQWTPGGEGIIYLRAHAERQDWQEVVIRQPPTGEPQVLARLPGKMGEAYTTWRWMEDGRVRIYHLSDEGVRIVDTAADGSDAKAKRLPGENLVVLKRVADFMRAVEKVPDLSEGEWPEPFAEKMKIVADYLDLDEYIIDNAPESVQKAFDEVVEAARQWEPVPAIPELPKEEAEPEPSAEKVKAVAEPLK